MDLIYGLGYAVSWNQWKRMLETWDGMEAAAVGVQLNGIGACHGSQGCGIADFPDKELDVFHRERLADEVRESERRNAATLVLSSKSSMPSLQ